MKNERERETDRGGKQDKEEKEKGKNNTFQTIRKHKTNK